MDRYVGLDLAKRTMDVCILRGTEKAVRYSGVKTDAVGREGLARLLDERDTVAMEACSYAFVLTRYLLKAVGCRVIILHPRKLQMIWKSETKTDKSDAWKLADYIQRTPEERMSIVPLPSKEEEELRSMVNRLHGV
jgi:transposase